MTLFTYEIPLSFTLKVWDIFLFEPNIVGLILSRLMYLKQNKLLAMNNDVSIK